MVVPLEEQESVGVKIAVVPFNDQRVVFVKEDLAF